MGGYLRKATNSQSVSVGPFINSVDFRTPVTFLTILNTDVKIVMNGDVAIDKNFGGGTHRINGIYRLIFNDDDTAVTGEMHVSIVMSGALPVWDKFYIVTEAVYDQLYAADAAGGGGGGAIDPAAVAAILANTITIEAKLPAELAQGRIKARLRRRCAR